MSATSHASRARTRRNGGESASPVRRRPRLDNVAYLYLIPAFAFYGIFMLRPIAESIWISFFDWDGITESVWTGWDNYAAVINNPLIWEALLHSLVFIVFYALLPSVLALIFVAVISRIRVYGLTFFRAVLFIPYVLSTVVVAVAWRWIYDINGPLNNFLDAIGLGFLTRAWIGDFTTALPSVGLIGTWIMFGLGFVLFMAGAQKIPFDLYEAARLDGAGAVREFFAVTLPGLRGEISVALVLMITAALRNFDIVWNTTSGGPGTSTTVPSYYVYQGAFMTRDVGGASALAVLLTIIILAAVGLTMYLLKEKEPRQRTQLRRRARKEGSA
ncbi:carbohydrate ABC transporter permease [Lysinibacter cavernae]|uniref:Raffinose/stachyose/melibiose transport system permease protein n=1 Tax=Lysinibacter cavernae TaxID=1640652 RepID=A0A7X5QYS2_9MICO|nr:sugar ABC transporter permease [Lysinibacter cavernae]NIH52485.1 raffinose/stachyose/melibiose transport system permease protein [Lysinibacter cavernae]